ARSTRFDGHGKESGNETTGDGGAGGTGWCDGATGTGTAAAVHRHERCGDQGSDGPAGGPQGQLCQGGAASARTGHAGAGDTGAGQWQAAAGDGTTGRRRTNTAATGGGLCQYRRGGRAGQGGGTSQRG